LKSGKILIGKAKILEFMGIKEILYQHFMSLGLPVVSINGQKYAHADRLDEWAFQKFSVQVDLEIPE